MSKEEYETLKKIEEMLEHLGIAEGVRKRQRGRKRSENIPWDKIKKKYALNI